MPRLNNDVSAMFLGSLYGERRVLARLNNDVSAVFLGSLYGERRVLGVYGERAAAEVVELEHGFYSIATLRLLLEAFDKANALASEPTEDSCLT